MPSRPASTRRAGWTALSPPCSSSSARTRTAPRSWPTSLNGDQRRPAGDRAGDRQGSAGTAGRRARHPGRPGHPASGAGTGTPASSASWPRGWWKRPAAPSSSSRWMSTARARAAAAACRASTCTPASPPASDILLRFGGHAMAAGLSVREENLHELRRRLNEWAARECPVLLHAPPLECDLSHPAGPGHGGKCGRAGTAGSLWGREPHPGLSCWKRPWWTASTRSRRASTAASACGRATPAFMRSGSAMQPEQLPYAMGDVVDAALNLSVYDSARGAAAFGPDHRAAPGGLWQRRRRADRRWCRRCAAARPLTDEQKARIAAGPSGAISSQCTVNCRPGAGTQRICSPCSQSSARNRTPARSWSR